MDLFLFEELVSVESRLGGTLALLLVAAYDENTHWTHNELQTYNSPKMTP